MAAIAVIIIGTFVTGAAAGIVAIASLGIRREERDFTLTGRAPDRKSQGARSLTGLYVRQRRDSPALLTVEAMLRSAGTAPAALPGVPPERAGDHVAQDATNPLHR